ncbi:MAG: CBS domain-containing protein [bacterium]|nr:MAG: CBS domain-containing protein [bacterium]
MFNIKTVEALGDLTVADLLTTDVTTVAPDSPIIEIVRIFRDYNFEGIPVVKKGYLVGMAMRRELLNLYFITERDLDEADTRKLFQLASLMDAAKKPVSFFMDTEPLTVPPDCKASRLAQLMLENDLFTFPVVTEKKSLFLQSKKRFIGIVTLTDMMPLLYEAICNEP